MSCRSRRRARWLASVAALVALSSARDGQAFRAGRQPLRPPAVHLDGRIAAYGTNVGYAGLWAGDLDRDGTGTREVVVAAGARPREGNEFWYVVSRRDGEYAQRWIGPWYPGSIASLAVANLDADAAREIVVATHHEIEVWDGATLAREKVLPVIGLFPTGLLAADLDGDRNRELVFCDDSEGVIVLHPEAGVPTVLRAGHGCRGLAVGDVDQDGAVEVVVGELDGTGFVLDATTGAVEWAYLEEGLAFGYRLRIADLDGAGAPEIVALGGRGNAVQVFSAVERRLLRSFPPFAPASDFDVTDTDSDGRLEFLLWDAAGVGSPLQCYDATTQQLLWHHPQPAIGRLDVADVDGDGARELVLGTGAWSLGAHRLAVLDAATRVAEWESIDIRAPFLGLAYGDVDGDGNGELAHTSLSSDGYQRQGRYVVHDVATGRRERLGPVLPNPDYWIPMYDLAAANVDEDPALELLAASGASIVCYDARTGAERWRTRVDGGLAVRSLQAADVDADGALEVVAATSHDTSDTERAAVYVLDARTGVLEWRSPGLGSGADPDVVWTNVALAPLDRDPGLEIVVYDTFRGEVTVFDGLTHAATPLGGQQATSADTPDRDGDGISELLLGTSTGEIRRVDPADGRVLGVLGRHEGEVMALEARDVTGDGVADYVLVAASRLHVQDGRSGGLTWSSDVLGRGVGASGSLLVGDFDGDGRIEIAVNNGRTGLDVFEVRPRPRR